MAEVKSDGMTQPAFQIIKNYLLKEIQKGVWKEGDMIPSESVLSAQFKVSRMTVNRAVKELTAEQILNRVQGSGTYVAQQKYQATLVAIKSIADEIRLRGHQHRSEIFVLESLKATEKLALQFQLKLGELLFHSTIVHYENNTPIQVEDRWVNAQLVPQYLQQDFTRITPNEYLVATAPLEKVDYEIEAIFPTKKMSTMLKMSAKEACLVLHRKTRSHNQIASIATMWHPGSRYQFTGSF